MVHSHNTKLRSMQARISKMLCPDSDSENENKPMFGKMNVKSRLDSSSDSSDSDSSPPKQRRVGGVRAVRGLGKLLQQKKNDGFQAVSTVDTQECNVYSLAVSNKFKAAEDGTFRVTGLDDNDEQEKQKKKKEIAGKVASRKPRSRAKPSPAKKQALIDLGEEEEEDSLILNSSQSQGRERSPTPPPTPQNTAPARGKRKIKGFAAAVKKLDSVSANFMKEADGDDDDDVMIIDLVSPTAAKKKQDEKQITVKIRSRSGIQRFNLGMTDDFSEVFRAMAAHEMVSVDRISICHNDAPIQPYDTPACINLLITDILDCYIQREKVSREACTADNPDVITLRVQGKDPKSRRSIRMNKHEPLERMMRMYASQIGIAYTQLSFTFDGEELNPTESAEDMELEDDFCIDVSGC